MSKIIDIIKNQPSSQLDSDLEKDLTPVKSKAKSQKKVSSIENKSLERKEEVVNTKSKTKSRSKSSTIKKKAVENEDEGKSQVSIVEEESEQIVVFDAVVKEEATSEPLSKPKPILLTPEQIKAREKIRLSTIYQAIGKIQVRVKLHEDEATILFGNREFPLFSAGFKKASRFTSLERVIAEQGSDLEIIVYPIIDNTNLVVTSFSYLNTVNTKNDRIYQDLRLNHFRLSGLWKTIDGQTCIQVHSNTLINPCIRSRLKQPLNVPVQWNECPIQEESKKNIYVSIETKFNFESCKFDYVRTLINPTKSHPPFPKYYSNVAPNYRCDWAHLAVVGGVKK